MSSNSDFTHQDSTVPSAVTGTSESAGQELPLTDVINDFVARIGALEESMADDSCSVSDARLELTALKNDLAEYLNTIEPSQNDSDHVDGEKLADAGSVLKNGVMSDVLFDGVFEEEPEVEAEETLVLAQNDTAPDQAPADTNGEQTASLEDNLAKSLSELEPAAGADSSSVTSSSGNTGFGFQSSFTPTGVIGLNDVGPIDPTALNYSVRLANNDLISVPKAFSVGPEIADALHALDESDAAPLQVTDTLDFEYGDGGSGSVRGSGSFSFSGSADGPDLTSNGDVITVTNTDTGYIGTTPDGSTAFELEIQPDGNYTFTQHKPLDHADGSDHDDIVTLNFGAVVTNGRGETATATIKINIADDGPSAADSVQTINEDVLSSGPITLSGDISADFGADGADSTDGIAINNTSGFTGATALNSGGQAVTIAALSTGEGYEGTLSDGTPVFRITFDDAGQYEFTQFQPLDHDAASDTITLNFGVTVQDFDGDTANANVDINIIDGVPDIGDTSAIGAGSEIFDETDFPANMSASGQLDVDFGADGGNLAVNGIANSSIPLSAGGQPVTITQTVSGYEGTTPDGQAVFTLDVGADGSYTFDLFGTLDHADTTDPNDIIQLTFGVTATDADGDTDTGVITINIADDGPSAIDDTGSANVGETIQGNVIDNDTVGQDSDGSIVSVNGQDVPENGLTIAGLYGTLTIQQDGSYSYTATSNQENAVDQFSYILRDGDGDTASATLSIVPNTAPEAVDDSYTLYELDASHFSAPRGANAIANYQLTDGATVYSDTNSDHAGFWYQIDILNNDSDPEGDVLTITQISNIQNAPNNSDIKIAPDGQSVLIRIGQDGNGANSDFRFDYTISDGHGGTDTAQVNIHITDYNSPLVIDLDGDGIELLPISDGVHFDMDADGTLNQTGWVDSDDGLLALDINQDGMINDQSELFGTATTDGFTVLGMHDNNADGVIDANDNVFNNLVVWQDVNSDGISQSGEMYTLGELGIHSISLSTTAVGYFIEGNAISHEGTITYEDGSIGEIVDAWFSVDDAETEVEGNPETGQVINLKEHWDKIMSAQTEEDSNADDGGVNLFAGSDVLSDDMGDELFADGFADNGKDFMEQAVSHGIDVIRDFSTDGGDVLDFSGMIQNYDPAQQAIDNFIFARDVDGGTILSVDVSGSGDAANAVDLVALEGMHNMDLQNLVENGNINVM